MTIIIICIKYNETNERNLYAIVGAAGSGGQWLEKRIGRCTIVSLYVTIEQWPRVQLLNPQE